LDVARDEAYRAEIRAAAAVLRERWAEWQGKDSLHAMAFGEPEEGAAAAYCILARYRPC